VEIKGRLRHAWALAHGWVLGVIGGVYALIGVLTSIRDNLLSPEARVRFDTFEHLPKWSWVTWVIIGLCILVVALFEGSYRIDRSMRLRVVGLEKAIEAHESDVFNDYSFATRMQLLEEEPLHLRLPQVRGLFNETAGKALAGEAKARAQLLVVQEVLLATSKEYGASGPHFQADRQLVRQVFEKLNMPGSGRGLTSV
jgi:hypothetical protein